MRNSPEVEKPTHEAVVKDLRRIRQKGITTIGRQDLPALRQAAVASGHVQEKEKAEPHLIEKLLRAAIDDIGGGRIGDAGAVLFGLRSESRGDNPARLRNEARDLFGVGLSRFRNHYEHIVIHEIAQQILRRCHDHSLRMAALAMEHRTPMDTHLAIDWLERFESYYAMWSPIYSTAISIAAYRSTLLEEDRPYDRPPTPEEPDGYTQELRARHYGWEALYFLARFYAELSRFETKFGGHFVLSSKAARADIQDATYLMYYWTPFSVEDESFLRIKYKEAGGEMHTFGLLKEGDAHFMGLHESWQRFLALCACSWDEKQPPERGHFHTHHTVATISEECSPHQLISAANDYCTIIDNEWDLIADWYRDSETRRRPVDPSRLYWKLREQQRRKGSEEWPPWGPPTP